PRAAAPRAARPGAAVPAAAVPARLRAFRGGERRRIDRGAEDVLLALERDSVGGQVVAAARALDRAGAGRGVERLARALRRGIVEQVEQVDLTRALCGVRNAGELVRAALEVRLHVVGRHARVALQDQGDRAGEESRRLGRAAAAEVEVAEPPLGVVDVD